MHLKSLKLIGFKSFVDTTTIPFNTFFNAVVGPNGCGKSNIIDAVRWVIGESSAKQLRGQSMADVIFNGSGTRKPLSRAAVELLFDNSAGALSGEFAKYNEISIRREVQRDGQSSYYLNGSHCRRKDIVDLFLGTGLGPRSYAIIEQGMVSRLIEAKPEELRVFLDEAAGISKYKERRRETENRIKHTNENLERINDIAQELGKQLKHLRRQANAAEKYKLFREEERQANLELQAMQWRNLSDTLTQQDNDIAVKVNENESIQAKKQQISTQLEEEKLFCVAANDQHDEVQRGFYALGADIARLEQKIKYISEQAKQWELELEQANSLHKELSHTTRESENQLAAIEQEIAELKPLQQAAGDKEKTLITAFESAEVNMKDWQSRWQSFQDLFSHNQQKTEVSKTQARHLEQEITRLKQREIQLSQELDHIHADDSAKTLTPLLLEADEIQAALKTSQASLSDMRNLLQESKNKLLNKRTEADVAQQQLTQTKARLTSLCTLQSASLKSDETALQWLSAQSLQDNQRIAQALKVDTGWEKAVEVVLVHFFDAVCIDDCADYSAELESLNNTHLSLFDLNATVSDTTGNNAFTSLLTKTSSHSNLTPFLSAIYIAADLNFALAHRHSLQAHESFITQAGVWVGPNWLKVMQVADEGESVLLREQEIKSLTDTLKQQTESAAKAKHAFEEATEANQTLEAKREVELELERNLNAKNTQIQSQVNVLQVTLESLKTKKERASAEQSEVLSTCDALAEKLLLAQTTHLETQEAGDLQATEKANLLTERDTLQGALTQARSALEAQRQAANQYEIRVASNETQGALLKQTIGRNKRQIEQANAKQSTLNSQLHSHEGDTPLAELEAALQAALTKQLTAKEALKIAADQLTTHKSTIDTYTTDIQRFSEESLTVQAGMQAIQLERQTTLVNQQNALDYIQRKEGKLDALLEGLPEEASQSSWQELLETLERKIQRLGPINLAAIDECQVLEERKTYLEAQQEDLHEALRILENAIHKIDKETRQKFKETFDIINQHFSVLFPKVFGGGHAELVLTENDLLQTGVAIKAQPPGKRNSTIHVLSGGEKALTAISLVFSFFKLNPAPFCILDEVDAPLDEANVGRFSQLIKEMSGSTQFIVISHNKLTIETADSLLGVTMHEPGASRLVSVDMKKAVEMAG